MDDNKRKLWVNGQFIEVSEKVYQVYMQGDRKMRYFEMNLKTERTILAEDGTVQRIIPGREDSLDRLIDDNAGQFSDAGESVEDAVPRKLAEDELHRALEKLTDEEYWAYDSTSVSSYSESLRQVKYGRNKDGEKLLQINLALIFGENSGLPF